MVYILLGEGFEETEAVVPCDLLRRGGVQTCFVSLDAPAVRGAHGIEITAELTVDAVEPETMELLVLPGGMGGVRSMERSEKAMALLDYAAQHGIRIGAICAAPTILGKRGLLRGRRAVCYPGLEGELSGAEYVAEPVVCDGNIICSMGPGTAFPFGIALLRALRGEPAAEEVRTKFLPDHG